MAAEHSVVDQLVHAGLVYEDVAFARFIVMNVCPFVGRTNRLAILKDIDTEGHTVLRLDHRIGRNRMIAQQDAILEVIGGTAMTQAFRFGDPDADRGDDTVFKRPCWCGQVMEASWGPIGDVPKCAFQKSSLACIQFGGHGVAAGTGGIFRAQWLEQGRKFKIWMQLVQQLLDNGFRFLVSAFTGMVGHNIAVHVDEVVSGPEVVMVGIPVLIIAVNEDRPGNAKPFHRLGHIVAIMCKPKLRCMDADNYKAIFGIPFVPGFEIGQGAQAVHTGVFPEINQHHMAALQELFEIEGFAPGVKPILGGAVESGGWLRPVFALNLINGVYHIGYFYRVLLRGGAVGKEPGSYTKNQGRSYKTEGSTA